MHPKRERRKKKQRSRVISQTQKIYKKATAPMKATTAEKPEAILAAPAVTGGGVVVGLGGVGGRPVPVPTGGLTGGCWVGGTPVPTGGFWLVLVPVG